MGNTGYDSGTPESLSKVPVRVTLFNNDASSLLLYIPDDQEVRLPTLVAPLELTDVKRRFREANVPVRLIQTITGRWTQPIAKARHDARAEAGSKQRLREAAQATLLRSSEHPSQRRRAEVLLEKQQIDESVRTLKARLGEARARAATKGIYMDSQQYRELEQRLIRLREQSQALQVELTQLKEKYREETQAAREQAQQTFHKRFLQAVKEYLEEDEYEALIAIANGEDEEEKEL